MPGSQTICSVFPRGLTHAFLSSFSLSVFSSKAGSLHSLRCAGDAVGTSVPWEGRTPSSCSTVIGLHNAQPYQGQRCSPHRLGQQRRWWHLPWFSLQQKQRNNQEETSIPKAHPSQGTGSTWCPCCPMPPVLLWPVFVPQGRW